jgi:hypothetical protein
MAQNTFSDGQEIIYQDLNDLQTHVRSELYDRVIYHMLQKQGLGFFQDAFYVDYQNSSSVSVRAGAGFQLDNTQVDPEPQRRLFFLASASIQTLASPDGTNNRIDLIVAKALRATTVSASRNFKDAITGTISAQSTPLQDDWLSTLQVVTGTPSGSPVAPATPSGFVVVAQVLVHAISGVASQGDITDERVIIPVADEAYIDTSAFPAGVVTQSTTARLKDVLLQLASFENTHQTAAEIPASPSGHTVAIGSNVQVQLDELDTLMTDIKNAITLGKGIDLIGYDPEVPADWSPAPAEAGAALDQLGSRVKAVEAGANIGPYIGDSFEDYIVPADALTGAGNTGLTDTNLTNPRGIKLADGKLLYGEERVYIRQIAKTGNYDANGLTEWAPTSPTKDARIRLYGQWSEFSGAGIYNLNYLSVNPGDYILITGVFDGVTMMGAQNTTGADQVEVWVDGVDTGTNFSVRAANIGQYAQVVQSQKWFNSQMLGLPQGLHTVKLVNGASDANAQIQFTGVCFINTTPLELASTMYLQKVQTSYAQQVPTLSTANANGGIVSRYVDRADGLRKEVVSNSLTFITAITGSVSAGATGFTINSATGLGNNNLLLIQDSASNSEIVLANSVNTFSGAITIAGAGLRNSYTNPTVSFYGKVNGAVNHSNERQGRTRHWTTMGTASNAGLAQVSELSVNANATIDYGFMEDGGTRLAGQTLYNRVASWNANEPYQSSLNIGADRNAIIYEGVFTGLDIFINGGTNGTNAGAITIVIDGITVVTGLVLPAKQSFWLKVASDLPLCHHIVQIGDADGGAFQYGFGQFQDYVPKYTATELALAKGNLLSHRNIMASYVWDNLKNPITNTFVSSSQGIYGISKGVVRHHWLTDAIVTGSGWSEGHSVAAYQAGSLGNSNTTNDKITKSFFGTGIDIRYQAGPGHGKGQVQIDGMNANTANFPSAAFNGIGYNASTGILDYYDTTNFEYSASLANLSATPQWHTITITVTGTKNISSTDYYVNVQAFDVHGACQNMDVGCGVRPMHSIIVGGVKDKRTLSYNGFDTLGLVPGFTALAISSTYGVANGNQVIPDGCTGDIYMPEDGEIQIDFNLTFRTTGSGNCEIGLTTDGSFDAITIDQNFSQGSGLYALSYSVRKFVKKGWHQIAGFISYSGSGSGYAYGSYRSLDAYAVPKTRAI